MDNGWSVLVAPFGFAFHFRPCSSFPVVIVLFRTKDTEQEKKEGKGLKNARPTNTDVKSTKT